MKITPKFIKRILLLILTVLFLLPAVISCKDNSGNDNNNNTDENQNSQSDEKSDSGETPPDSATTGEYEYPDMDGGGRDFTIFAPSTTWGFYTDIVFDEMTGDILDDAIYKRNRFIEDKFNINLKEMNAEAGVLSGQLRRIITSGEDVYDAALIPVIHGGAIGNLIIENLFYNLREIPTMNLDEKWYNQMMLKEAAIGKGDKLYYASCDIDMMTLQCVMCVFFNQDMMTNLGLDLPYNIVREGKWTFDVFNQYMKDGAQLNGDETFKWNRNGNSIYGMSSYQVSATALLAGSGERMTVTDSNGVPHLTIEGQRFIDVIEKIKGMLLVNDGSYLYAGDMPSRHCEPLFMGGRAMMVMVELKGADVFREMDATFGIIPSPKYDQYQENYYTLCTNGTPVLVIPATNPREEFTGAVLDAMAYVSNRDVTPIFFDVTVSQKRLRNDDSIDMLQIIRDNNSFNVGFAYGWIEDFFYPISQSKDVNMASQTEKYKDKIIANIEKTMEFFE